MNYVIPCWSGSRRTPDLRREIDASFYLRKHIQSLSKLPHDLAQITIVVPENPNEPPLFREYLLSIPAQIQGAKVVIMERPNLGMSYGSFSDCYKRFRTEFDFYFFVEDDYVFTQPHFDKLHLAVMEADSNCGYLCGLAWATPPPMHAGIANGMFRTKALEAVFFLTDGFLPHAMDSNYRTNEKHGQMGQSQAIIQAGYQLRDWSGRFKVLFREADFSIVTFHGSCAETIMRPV